MGFTLICRLSTSYDQHIILGRYCNRLRSGDLPPKVAPREAPQRSSPHTSSRINRKQRTNIQREKERAAQYTVSPEGPFHHLASTKTTHVIESCPLFLIFKVRIYNPHCDTVCMYRVMYLCNGSADFGTLLTEGIRTETGLLSAPRRVIA